MQIHIAEIKDDADLAATLTGIGNWYQASFPTLPSGRVDYASVVAPNIKIFGDGDMKTALTHLCDVGQYVAKIITDDRTVNKYVFCYGELLSQEEIFVVMEQLSGEVIERQYVCLFLYVRLAFWILSLVEK